MSNRSSIGLHERRRDTRIKALLIKINLSIILASIISQRKGLATRLAIIILTEVDQVMVADRLACEQHLTKLEVDVNSSPQEAQLRTQAS